jgi:hypothetical protein
MPMLASFMAAEAAGAMGALEVAGAMGAAEAAGAMELGSAGAFDMGLGGVGEAMGLGLGDAALGAMAPTTGAGITQAALGPATQGIVAGGEGAGAAGINSQMVNAVDQAAGAVSNSGVGQAAAPMARSFAPAADAVAGNADKAALLSNEGYTGNVAGINAGTGAEPTSFFDNPFMKGVSSVINFAEKNPFRSAGIAYMGAKRLGLLDDNAATAANRTPDKGMGYSMSPDFKGRFANPEDYQYTPKRYNYAEGGIMQAGGVPAYAKGGNLSSTLDSYTQMMDQRARPPSGKSSPRGERGDAGIYYDLDPDTRYQDALTAAQIRQAKVNRRANVQMPGIKRPTPMGQIDLTPPGTKKEAAGSSLDPENAAQGGIMRASTLGGYAAGGNPRLLKGPGDGMSDNIPATINARQPARLADGEFVVPADVVSHLGNGSTDAGAKKLHEMMTKVRRERTGNPKQGKKINPNKFVPK